MRKTPPKRVSGQAFIDSLSASIERGIADAEAGRTRAAGEVFGRLEAKYRGLRQGSGSGK